MNAFFIAGALAALALFPSPLVQTALATAASTLFESTPFILAGMALARMAPARASLLVNLLGCGCSGGPAARSLPVAAATWIAFGPGIAALRWAAAIGMGSMFARIRAHESSEHDGIALAEDLLGILPFGLAAGVIGLVPRTAFAHIHPAFAALGAASAAVLSSPCGFGGIALASTFRSVAPAAAAGVLITAGIIDLRALRPRMQRAASHDAIAYAIASLSCGLVAFHHGNALVNPRFSIPLYASCVVLLLLAWKYRHESRAALRWAPALMLAGAVLSAPPPLYYATQTTLSEAFAGEPVDFSGALASNDGHFSIVRYAVTCCRADAQPVSVRLLRSIKESPGQWIHATGILVHTETGLALDLRTYERMAAPNDPFMYR
ncbi:MAG: hypothetical protein M3N19_05620 [Candidatus Eremiobacteraeota bacterium]|nr:hypothetical protein [Candidatus Eremiobacteraeota bacterium]